jgi:hypothetical protein
MIMQTIPRKIHPVLRDELKELPDTWEVVKKKDHYFLLHQGRRVACVAGNASTQNDRQAKKSLHTIRRYKREREND